MTTIGISAETGVRILTLAVPAITFLFAIFFFGIWTRWKTLHYLKWLASGFLLFGAAILSQILLVPRDLGLNCLVTCTLYIGATLTFVEGNIQRLNLKTAHVFNITISVLTFLVTGYFFYGIRVLDARVYALNFGLAFILLATALRMLKGAHRLLDRILSWTLLLFAFQFFPRTLLTIQHLSDAAGFVQIEPSATSLFWVWMNLSFLVFMVMIGLLMSINIASDIFMELHQIASTDSMTQLLNRRGFKKATEHLVPAASRRPFLILFDLDNFKYINDTFGHDAGDAVLKKVGSLLNSSCRSSDIAARMGGEEFALLLDSQSQEETHEIAERLRQGIANLQFRDAQAREFSVTASIGVIEIRTGEELEHALKRADRLMYDAKNTGKNKISAEWNQEMIPVEDPSQKTSVSPRSSKLI